MNLKQVQECFAANDYQAHHEISKVVEFSSPRTKRWVYLRKDSGLPGRVRIVIEPTFDPEPIFLLDGVNRPAQLLQHGSNMRRFPQRCNKGKALIHFGIAIDLNSLGGLERALRLYDEP